MSTRHLKTVPSNRCIILFANQQVLGTLFDFVVRGLQALLGGNYPYSVGLIFSHEGDFFIERFQGVVNFFLTF